MLLLWVILYCNGSWHAANPGCQDRSGPVVLKLIHAVYHKRVNTSWGSRLHTNFDQNSVSLMNNIIYDDDIVLIA